MVRKGYLSLDVIFAVTIMQAHPYLQYIPYKYDIVSLAEGQGEHTWGYKHKSARMDKLESLGEEVFPKAWRILIVTCLFWLVIQVIDRDLAGTIGHRAF